MNNQVKPMVMVIATVLLSAIFSFLNLYEFVVVGLLKRTEGYPFGDEGPMPWYYESAQIYAAFTCTWGIVFLLMLIIGLVVFIKRKFYAQVIALTTTISLVILQIFTA